MYKKVFVTIIAALMVALMSFASVSAAEDPKKDEFPVIENADSSENSASEQNAEESGSKSTATRIWGDVDGSGVVDVNDVTEYQLILVEKHAKTDAFDYNGDANIDGKKNIWDVTTIQYYLAGTFKKLPVTTDGYYGEIIRP